MQRYETQLDDRQRAAISQELNWNVHAVAVADSGALMGGKTDRKGKGNILIRKEEVVEGEGHGGAWKVAYADFVTAMMAFFLLMWLLNATTEEQRKGLADYFSPNSVLSHNSSGTGQPFGGRTAFSDGAMLSDLGSPEVTVGKQPVVDQPEDDGSDVASHTQSAGSRRQAAAKAATATSAQFCRCRAGSGRSGHGGTRRHPAQAKRGGAAGGTGQA